LVSKKAARGKWKKKSAARKVSAARKKSKKLTTHIRQKKPVLRKTRIVKEKTEVRGLLSLHGGEEKVRSHHETVWTEETEKIGTQIEEPSVEFPPVTLKEPDKDEELETNELPALPIDGDNGDEDEDSTEE
jgi:hypothetical protein